MRPPSSGGIGIKLNTNMATLTATPAFANMLAGHTTLKVFAGFIVSMVGMGGVASVSGLLPLIMVIALTALEFLIAFLQAYVFAILTCLYLSEAVNMEHH